MSDDVTENLALNRMALAQLVAALLPWQWQRECEVIPEYLPPYPREGERPRCVVKCPRRDVFLRYSCGPAQGFFWDCYGDDMQRPELALLALAHAPAPPAVRAFGE